MFVVLNKYWMKMQRTRLVRFTFRSAQNECYKPYRHKLANPFWVKKPTFSIQDFKTYLHAPLEKNIKKILKIKKLHIHYSFDFIKYAFVFTLYILYYMYII